MDEKGPWMPLAEEHLLPLGQTPGAERAGGMAGRVQDMQPLPLPLPQFQGLAVLQEHVGLQGLQLETVPLSGAAQGVALGQGLGVLAMDKHLAAAQTRQFGGTAGVVDMGVGQEQVAGRLAGGLLAEVQDAPGAGAGPAVDEHPGLRPLHQVAQAVARVGEVRAAHHVHALGEAARRGVEGMFGHHDAPVKRPAPSLAG